MLSHFEKFCQTIARLRSPDGCPWDREQTHESLIRYLLEETYEVIEAINKSDYSKLKEELGDLLLQVVLQAQLADEEKHFDINEVAQAINNKMISRHPHVFAGQKLETSGQVLAQWEELKARERSANTNEYGHANDAQKDKPKSALDGVPEMLPALLKALKISEKAVNQGFEWEKEEDIWSQLDSEIKEFREAVIDRNKASDIDGEKAQRSEARRQSRAEQSVETRVEPSGARARQRLESVYLEMGDILLPWSTLLAGISWIQKKHCC